MKIWDYQLRKDWKPTTDAQWEWFLVRKINYGELAGLRKKIIEKFFPKIKRLLDPGKREMLAHFLKQ